MLARLKSPIGDSMSHKKMLDTCCIDPSQEPLANDIHIAQDQEPVQILGA